MVAMVFIPSAKKSERPGRIARYRDRDNVERRAHGECECPGTRTHRAVSFRFYFKPSFLRLR